MSVEMKLKQVPAPRGATWVRQGIRVFAMRPVALSALFATFLFGMVMMLQLPIVGPIITLASLPLVSLVFMLATQVTLRGLTPTLVLFAVPFRRGRTQSMALAQLGGLYAAGTVVIMLLSHWIDGGRLVQLQGMMQPGAQATPEQVNALLQDPMLQAGLLTRLGLAALLSVPFWHAPALVHWAGQSVAKSLFFSTVAMWRNRGAFLIYGLTCTAAVFVFGMVSSIVLALFGQPELGMIIVMPAGLLAATIFYASLFFTFFDSFEPSGPPSLPED
jgi:hypothetical protein